MVEPTPITIQLLQDIRDEMRAGRETMERRFESVDRGFDAVDRRFEASERRFEALETVLRDLSQQLVVIGRGVKVAIRSRRHTEGRLDDHEERIARLERKDS